MTTEEQAQLHVYPLLRLQAHFADEVTATTKAQLEEHDAGLDVTNATRTANMDCMVKLANMLSAGVGWSLMSCKLARVVSLEHTWNPRGCGA